MQPPIRGKWTDSNGVVHKETFVRYSAACVVAIVDGAIVGAYTSMAEAVRAARAAVPVTAKGERE